MTHVAGMSIYFWKALKKKKNNSDTALLSTKNRDIVKQRAREYTIKCTYYIREEMLAADGTRSSGK